MQGQSVRRIVYRLPARLGSNEAGRHAHGSWSRHPGGAIPPHSRVCRLWTAKTRAKAHGASAMCPTRHNPVNALVPAAGLEPACPFSGSDGF